MRIIFFFFFCLLVVSCTNNPKVIKSQPKPNDSEQSSGIFTEPENDENLSNNSATEVIDDIHSVVVKAILSGDKYSYLNVDENGKEYWIATLKKEIDLGETYFFKTGLLKTNFESKEFDRVFDEIYLVSSIVKAGHGSSVPKDILEAPISEDDQKVESEDIVVEGSIRIADLLKDQQKYKNKIVQISGKCVKVNPNILGTNWIHLKDGSKDDYDFVVTTDEVIMEGQVVTIKGVVSLEKDFGAGYKYEIIVEEATVL